MRDAMAKYQFGNVWDGFDYLFPTSTIKQPMDISESETEYTIHTNVPGYERNEIDISVDNNILTIKSEKKQENETKNKNYIHKERIYQNFTRSISLNDKVSTEDIKAKLNNGVLEVTIPKRNQEETKIKKINII